MSKQSEFDEYRRCVRAMWIAGCFARTFAEDLIQALYGAGYLVDNVTVSLSDAEHIVWIGTCYDADLTSYKFVATWTFNMIKFTASDKHYYELTDIDLECVE